MSSSPLRLAASAVRPVLVLGLVGFTAEEQARIERQVNVTPVGGVHWRVGSFSEADAWLACGERARLPADDEVIVESPAADSPAVRLWLPQVDRPIAFSRPLPSQDFEPACVFDGSQTSLVITLAKFTRWLRPRTALLCLTDLLTRDAAKTRRSRVYHVMGDNRLVAVVDLKGDIGVLPEATLGDIARASWVPRPDAARYVPDSFVRRNTRELLWEFAGRTDRDLLPAHYRTRPVLLRRAPLLAQRMLTDAQLFVMRELAEAPRTVAQLCKSGKFSAGEIVRALTAFYLVGCVTSSQHRVPMPIAMSRTAESNSSWPAFFFSSQQEERPGRLDLTVPGVLPVL